MLFIFGDIYLIIIFVEELFGLIILFLVVGLWCILLNDGNMTVLLIFDLPFAFITVRYQALVDFFLFLVRSYFISTLASCSVSLRVSVLILSRELFSVVFFFVVFVAVGVYVMNSCDGIYVCSDSTIIMDWIFNRILIFILSTCSVIIVLTVIGLFRRIIVTHYSYCRCFSFPICHRSLVSCCRYFNFFVP